MVILLRVIMVIVRFYNFFVHVFLLQDIRLQHYTVNVCLPKVMCEVAFASVRGSFFCEV